ncbi:hypothetical protein C5Y96_08530 [Blastopirellula marina]|uniref:AbrB family transcriptional regulator n=1 Tax=Blastopirellula marina TaxID=124 RepID=A0A2S8FU40_9BACT|nr:MULTISPECIES: hypothetical protein [Pirellulaceae]PQO35692.1 hypothetical protein C5Y96_08530 [Blastopirellula marina]RCS53266.1 hypothetical protein DTL36_08540 [Bremerella cremea]
MIVRLKKQGDRYVLELDASVVEQLQLDETTPLEITQLEDGIKLSKSPSGISPEAFQDAIKFADENFPDTFRKLAE